MTTLVWCVVQSAGELCRVAESDQGQFVQACNVPSIILSAYLSALQQQQQSTSHSAAGIGQSQAGCHVREMTGSDTISATNAHLATGVQCTDGKPATQAWRPLLLIVPLRLGLSKISEIYYNALKVLCDIIQTKIVPLWVALLSWPYLIDNAMNSRFWNGCLTYDESLPINSCGLLRSL